MRDVPGGWVCAVNVAFGDGAEGVDPGDGISGVRGEREHEVRLSWSDHDYWCGGRLAPGVMSEQVVRYLVEHGVAGDLPARFDAGRARRWRPSIDTDLRQVG